MDYFDIDSVPEEDRIETARKVADIVLTKLSKEQASEVEKLENTATCG